MPRMQFAKTLSDNFRTVGELFHMLRINGRWWAIPLFFVIIVLSFVLVGLQGIPYVAPFIYAVF